MYDWLGKAYIGVESRYLVAFARRSEWLWLVLGIRNYDVGPEDRKWRSDNEILLLVHVSVSCSNQLPPGFPK